METNTMSKEFADALAEVRLINRRIARSYRYTCGIETLVPTEGKENHMHGFFLSPDYQRADLRHALQNAGWRITHHEADYYWKAQKWKPNSTVRIIFTYTEGDISLYQVDTTTTV